jgi:hypothetical protein
MQFSPQTKRRADIIIKPLKRDDGASRPLVHAGSKRKIKKPEATLCGFGFLLYANSCRAMQKFILQLQQPISLPWRAWLSLPSSLSWLFSQPWQPVRPELPELQGLVRMQRRQQMWQRPVQRSIFSFQTSFELVVDNLYPCYNALQPNLLTAGDHFYTLRRK